MYAFCDGFPGWINWRLIWCSSHQRPSLLEMNSGPLSTLILCGLPRHWIVCSSMRTTRSAGSEVSISIANASRLKSSSKFSVLNFLPLRSAALIKSIDQLILVVFTASSGYSIRAGSLLLLLRFIFSFNNLYTRWTRLWFHSKPSLRMRKYIFQNPSVGRCSARLWSLSMTIWSSRWLL